MKRPNWKTVSIKLGSLVPWENNPVKISEHDAEELRRSLEKFGEMIPLIANAPLSNGKRRLIDGHQRRMVEMAADVWGPRTMVDVRVPDRMLTDKECEEASIRLRRNTGEFDINKLFGNFDSDDLLNYGFEEDELLGLDFEHPKLKEQESNIRPRTMFRMLVSVPVSQAAKVKKIAARLEKIDGAEVLYGANNDKQEQENEQ